MASIGRWKETVVVTSSTMWGIIDPIAWIKSSLGYWLFVGPGILFQKSDW